MSLPVLVGFAGVLVAAVATGMLAGRCVRQPRADVILWAVATLGLTVALAAQSMGFASGFGPATFRAVQLCALLLAPMALAWGLVELVARSGAVKFGIRLVSGALIVVAAVILATDPLTGQPFGKSWPSAGPYSQPFSRYVLDLVLIVTLVVVAACVALAGVHARNEPRWRQALPTVASVALAVLVTEALHFSLPDQAAYPLLSLMAAAFVWFGATRLQNVPGRATQAERASESPGSGGADGRPDGRPGPDDYRPQNGLVADGVPAGGYPAYGPSGPQDPRGRPPFAAFPGPGGQGPVRRAPDRPQPAGTGPGSSSHATGHGSPAAPALATATAPATAPAPAPARPYGRILIFTVIEDRVADFDRLAEAAAEEVMTAEPDTLVFVIHLVPNAPLQRIFYEVYRDRKAFERHENQPYMKRFVADRRACVLATNVIELRLKYAKVAPLPTPQPAGVTSPPGAPSPASAFPASAGPAGMRASLAPAVPPAARRLQPLPPPGAPRPGRPSQLPPAARRYGDG